MFQIRYNASTNHIDGIEPKTQDGRGEVGGVVVYSAENACGALTRGRLARGREFESITEALRVARIASGRKMCRNCEKAAEALIASETEPVKVTVNFASHGQYQTSARSIDALYAEFAEFDIPALHAEIKELSGDPGYEVHDLTTRFECFMILAELTGRATN